MFRRGFLLLLAILLTLGFFANGRAAPVEQIGPAPFAFPTNATVLSSANVRAGPGTEYAIISGARAGQTVSIVGCNIDCSWYKLAEDCWIAAFLVKPELPVPPTPTVGVVYIPTIVVNGAVIVPDGIPQATQCPQTNAQVNTYAGPSTFYPVVDTRPAHECVSVIGRNTPGDWFQLSHGMWIAASAILYAEPIETMPVTDRIFTATLLPTPTPTLLPTATPVIIVTPVVTITVDLSEIITVGEWKTSGVERKAATSVIWTQKFITDGVITADPVLFAPELVTCVDRVLAGSMLGIGDSYLARDVAVGCAVLMMNP